MEVDAEALGGVPIGASRIMSALGAWGEYASYRMGC
jgi:hypothetical protein